MNDGTGRTRLSQPDTDSEAVPDEKLGVTIAETLTMRLQRLITELAPGFEPGRRLDVDGIGQRFGVSATPVKQALKRLEERGLVEIKPRRGHFVTLLSETDVREIMAARAALEQAAIRLCASTGLAKATLAGIRTALKKCGEAVRQQDSEGYRKADLEFHRLWVVASKNKRLIELYDFLLAQAQIVYVYVPHNKSDIGISLAEHKNLLQIAERGDWRALEEAIANHWQNSTDRALTRYQDYLRKGEEFSSDASRLPLKSGLPE